MNIVRSGGGIPVVAHPIRVGLPHDAIERNWLASLKADGPLGLEVYHSEHDSALQAYYVRLAEELALIPTGGSDFHGSVKPDIELGTGRRGNIHVPYEFLTGLKRASAVFS
jgi:predicted metal-dependent phosphoesterase TrpH